MKKLVLILLLLTITLNFISAAEIELVKEEYYPTETLQAEISGDFPFGLKSNNIAVYKGDRVHPTPTESGFLKLGRKYIYYAVLPYSEGNYSVKIKDTKHYVDRELIETDIIKNFTIVGTEDAYLSISPGYITTTKNFEIDVTILNEDSSVTATFVNKTKSLDIIEGDTETFAFSIKGITEYMETEVKISIGGEGDSGESSGFFDIFGGGSILGGSTYRIPVAVFPPDTPEPSDEDNDSNKPSIGLLDFDPNEIKATILKDKDYFFEIYIENEANESIDIEVSTSASSTYLDISPLNIDIDPGEREKVEVTINTDRDLDEELVFSYGNDSVSLPIDIRVTEDIIDVDIQPDITIEEKTCQDSGGNVCADDETCEGTNIVSKDGTCCVGTCKGEKTGGSGWVWGLLILLILGVAGWYIYDKMKKGPKRGKEIDRRTKRYEERFHPRPSSEVRSSLSKI